MIKPVKKHAFLLPFPRLFTRGERDAYDAIPFQSSESYGDEQSPALAAPAGWSAEAVGLMAEGAACATIPADLRALEENTVPSWLWRHQSRGTRRVAEGDLRHIFDRAVGSAAAKGWTLGLFSSEKNARAFYDEARFALMQRHIAFAPDVLRLWGLNWAYGLQNTDKAEAKPNASKMIDLSNASLDAQAGKSKNAPSAFWKKLFGTRANQRTEVTVRLTDIANDWYSAETTPARAAIDILALRHNDGSINIDALRHAARLATILLDLQDVTDVTIGLANLAPLLLALGLAYDSEAGRAMAASLAALVTAECYAVSAEMAALRGASPVFDANREAVMRGLRNHCRAAHGDANDYEKISVLPIPLSLKNCPDLTLAAQAQSRWDDALSLARTFGLRAVQVTDLTPSLTLAMLMQSASQGLEPMRELTGLTPDDAGVYRTHLHPAVGEALARLDYPRPIAQAVAHHIAGSHSLIKAPAINARSLRQKGLSDSAIERIEAYIPCVNSIRLAVTPWVVGVDFCRIELKIPAKTLESPHFDLLQHLGFSDDDVTAANQFVYGHGTVRNAKILHLRHRPLFACGSEVSADARLRMAAAVQSFISGDTGMIATLPVTQGVERGADVTLSAWRRGLKSLTIAFDPALTVAPARTVSAKARRIKPALHAHARPMGSVKRASHGKKAAPVASARKNSERRTRSH